MVNKDVYINFRITHDILSIHGYCNVLVLYFLHYYFVPNVIYYGNDCTDVGFSVFFVVIVCYTVSK